LGQLEKLLPDKDRHSQLEKYSAYIDTLMEQPSCSEETFKEHQKRIREVALRSQLLRSLSGAKTDVLNLSEHTKIHGRFEVPLVFLSGGAQRG
jgi:hypothetical protein